MDYTDLQSKKIDAKFSNLRNLLGSPKYYCETNTVP